MKTFDEYVSDWFEQYLADHEETEDFDLAVFNAIIELNEGETINDYLGEDEPPADYLLGLDSNTIYSKFFGYDAEDLSKTLPDIPSTQDFLTNMFKQSDAPYQEYGFFNEFVEDMAYHAEDYSNPIEFFMDLQQSGCSSGMIGMLIYNSDCLEIFGRCANDMEEFRERLEDEMGEPIQHKDGSHHYVWICWLCYEELAFSIARELFPNEF